MKDFYQCRIETCVKVNNNIYFMLEDYNLLCCCNLANEEVDVLGSIPEEAIDGKRLCGKILEWKEKLVLLPLNAKKIWIYDLSNRIWDSIEIDHPNIAFKFLEGLIYNDILYAFGHWYPGIVKIELFNGESTYIDCEKMKNGRDELFGTQIAQKNEKVILPVCNQDVILEFDLSDSTIHERKIENEGNGFTAALYQNDVLWLASRKGQTIINVDENGNENRIIGKKIDELFFHGFVLFHDELYLPSSHFSEMIIVEKKGIKKINKEICLFCNVIDDNTFMISYVCGKAELYNEKSKNTIQIRLSREKIENYFTNCVWNKQGIQKEDDILGVDIWIKKLINRGVD